MSKIEILNRALLKLGEPPISSFNDAAFGKTYELIYDDILRLLLSVYPWRFAVTRVRVAQRLEKFGERFMYQLPADFLMLIKVYEKHGKCQKSGYEIADHAIVVDDDNGVEIEYVRYVENDDIFPPLFKEAMAAKLAAELAMRVKQAISFKQVFDNEFYNLVRQAELNNEIMKDTEVLPDSSWVSVRQCW